MLLQPSHCPVSSGPPTSFLYLPYIYMHCRIVVHLKNANWGVALTGPATFLMMRAVTDRANDRSITPEQPLDWIRDDGPEYPILCSSSSLRVH